MRGIALFALLLIPLSGCLGTPGTDTASVDAGTDGETGPDGGPGAAVDASLGADAGTFPPSPENEFAAARDGIVGACFDGEDNDTNSLSDCADPSCQAGYPSCCVGASSATCCEDAVERTFPMDACTGSLSGCTSLGAFVLFGSPPPSVGVAMGDTLPSFTAGGDTDHSGMVFPGVLDPRLGEIALRAEIAASSDEPTGGQIDALALGLVDADTNPSAVSTVTPVVAIQISRNRHELALVLLGDVVQRWAITDPLFHEYALAIQPDGAVSLTRDGATPPLFERSAALPLGAPLRAIAYGRTDNPTGSASPPVRARGLAVTTRTCDMPGAITRSADTVVPAPLADTSWADGIERIENPHVLRWVDGAGATQVRMALVVDGEIQLAQPGAGGFQLIRNLDDPALVVSEAWASEGVADPVLRAPATGPLELWYTGYAGGEGTIGRALWDVASGRFVPDRSILGADDTGTSYEQPSLYELGGQLFLVATVRDASGNRIDVFRMDGDTATFTQTVTRPRGDDLFAFDRDEVADPAVIVIDGVARLYFAGRRGTRWGIGALVFHDADVMTWMAPPQPQVLAGDAEGFDALGVRDPAPFSIEAADGTRELRLYYTGTEGVRMRIGVASGALPPVTP